MGKIELFVVGGSAGGLEALRKIVPLLPRDFPAPICIVLHTAPDSPGFIPELLSAAGDLNASYARNDDKLEGGRIFVAPPDHHLIIADAHRLKLGMGPKENRFRPAIDPLFRSAAAIYGPSAAGIILSGGLDDGAAGLAAIKDRGGLAIVQSPSDALVPGIPNAARRTVAIDQSLPAKQIAQAMIAYAREYAPAPAKGEFADIEKEIQFAMGTDTDLEDIAALGQPSLFTCPECHGAMVRMRDANPPRFRCHTGHAFTIESLVASQEEVVESNLWSAVRALEEQASLLTHLAEHLNGPDAQKRRDALLSDADDVQWRSRLVRDALRPE